MSTYTLIDRMMDGLVRIERDDAGQLDRAVWDRTKVRKLHTCAVSGETIRPGEQAYRPLGNSLYRYERIAAHVLDDLRSVPTGQQEER